MVGAAVRLIRVVTSHSANENQLEVQLPLE
jgi:hypothetical protein